MEYKIKMFTNKYVLLCLTMTLIFEFKKRIFEVYQPLRIHKIWRIRPFICIFEFSLAQNRFD